MQGLQKAQQCLQMPELWFRGTLGVSMGTVAVTLRVMPEGTEIDLEKIKDAISLCERALQVESQNVESYLNLGKVYLRAGLKIKAVETFRRGLKIDSENPEIIAELQLLGIRKKSVIPSLPRDNFLNKYLGIILSRLGLR